ncbi:uncharacterized protein LOC134678745 [Cydia fagiglandana]|uniref:uncharacterized protein LOC134678745 n=1 Tax=Cydia fagiglandana TaxID=1458189 RepID=UPI002FEE5B47
MAFEKPPVIVDTGSYTIKTGFACDNHPVAIFRTAVGRPSYLNGSYGKEPYDVYVGDAALEQDEDLEISYPVVKGRIVHWDNIERILHHILYRELKVAPEDRAIMLSLATSTPMSDKFKCCEIIFEALNCVGICIQSQAVLALYGSGYTTGITVDMGYDKVDISPVYEGGLIAYAQTTTGIPSLELHDYIRKLLEERNINITSQRVLRDLKKTAYITKNAAYNVQTGKKTFTLPDGEVIDISNEAFMAGEVLFQPELAVPGWDVLSIPKAVQKTSEMCDSDLRSELFSGVVPCGGMAMIPGLCPRLKQDLEVLTGEVVNVYSSDEAYALSWLGGAAYGGMPTPKIWVTKRQYEDFGEKIVKNKFT